MAEARTVLYWSFVASLGFFVVSIVLLVAPALAQEAPTIPLSPASSDTPGGIHLSLDPGQDLAGALKVVLLMTGLALLPALLMTMTCFTRIIIVFGFLRQALGTQQTPPNQVMVGLALFLTLFVMAPTLAEIEKNAYDPYVAGELTTTEALDAGAEPLKTFMLRQTYEKDLGMFFQMSGQPKPETRADVPMLVLIPAYITSELKTAFEIGFLIYVPFLIIDMLVASVLMSMGMMMVPPVIISLPFKLLLFVMIDGWALVIGALVQSFA